MTWAAVQDALPQAKALVFDGCHKIYLAMDDEQVEDFRSIGYGEVAPGVAVGFPLVPTDGSSRLLPTEGEWSLEQQLQLLHDWYDASCGLRFIDSVATDKADPNRGFVGLIEQFEFDEDDDEPYDDEAESGELD